VLPSSQKLTLRLLVTITLEVVPFLENALFSKLLPFLNVSWTLCPVRAFSIACDSASVTSVVLEWRPFSFIFNQPNKEKLGGWATTVILSLVKYSLVKKEVLESSLS
jgi:hypothetical protein